MKRQRIFKLFVNYEKEEAWLNKLASQGLHCVDYVIGRYTFKKGAPGEYTYRIQLLENMPTKARRISKIVALSMWQVTFAGFICARKQLMDHLNFSLTSTPGSLTIDGLSPCSYPSSWLNLLNLGAALLLAIPTLTYSRQFIALNRERKIRE